MSKTSGFDPLLKAVKVVALAGALGAVAGLGVAQLLHPRWTGKLTIQIGQITTPSGAGGVTSRPIENQLTAVERYNSPTLRLRVLKSMGLPEPQTGAANADQIFETLRATPARSPDVLNVQVSAYSREQATRALATSYEILAAEHHALLAPAVTRMKSDLAMIANRLTATEQEYTRLYKSLDVAGQRVNSTTSSRDVLLSNVTATVNTQALKLRQESTDLSEALSPIRTYATRPIGETYVPERPSSASTAMITAIGAALGVIASIAFLLFQHSKRLTPPGNRA